MLDLQQEVNISGPWLARVGFSHCPSDPSTRRCSTELEVRGDVDNGNRWALYLEELLLEELLLEELLPGAAKTEPMLATAQTAVNPKTDFILLDVGGKTV
jgi:hypothetical protein